MSPLTRFLEKPLMTSPGQPLRVAVYSRISEGIRSGTLIPGSLLPRETELGVALRVSRTVVREALMLLEEDGLIVTKRGVGRFVANAIPSQELGGFQPFESLLAEDGAVVTVSPLEFTLQSVTDFVSAHLGLAAEAEFWFRECTVSKGGQPVALVQEYLPDEQYLAELNGPIAQGLRAAAGEPSTLLKSLTDRFGPVFTAGSCRISATIAGPTRAQLLDIKASDPLLVLTQAAELDGVAAYVSKCALAPAFGNLTIGQWKPA